MHGRCGSPRWSCSCAKKINGGKWCKYVTVFSSVTMLWIYCPNLSDVRIYVCEESTFSGTTHENFYALSWNLCIWVSECLVDPPIVKIISTGFNLFKWTWCIWIRRFYWEDIQVSWVRHWPRNTLPVWVVFTFSDASSKVRSEKLIHILSLVKS